MARPTHFGDCRAESLPHSVDSGREPGAAGEITTLADISPEQKATVTRVQGQGTLRRRLMDLGLISRTPVVMERPDPLGDSVEVLVEGTRLSLRRDEASAVQVDIDD